MHRRCSINQSQLKDLNIPYIRELGVHTESSGRSLPMHINNGFEIVYVFSGRYRWEMEDGATLFVRGRQLSLTMPNEAHHGYLDHFSPGKILFIVFDFDRGFMDRVQSLTRLDLLKLRKKLLNQGNGSYRVFNEVHTAAESLSEQLKRIQNIKNSRPLDRAIIQCDIEQFILASIRGILDSKQEHESNPLLPLMSYIKSHITEKLSIENLEEISGWGRTQLYLLFHRYIGQTPTDYIQSIRCDNACIQLKEKSESITEISFNLGFSSSQYFSRVFKKYIGLTPGEYRQQIGK